MHGQRLCQCLAVVVMERVNISVVSDFVYVIHYL